jgi:hypothetical protein
MLRRTRRSLWTGRALVLVFSGVTLNANFNVIYLCCLSQAFSPAIRYPQNATIQGPGKGFGVVQDIRDLCILTRESQVSHVGLNERRSRS